MHKSTYTNIYMLS